MENMEEIFHFLEDFSKRKPKVIPQELNEYLAYVARTGDPVYQWTLVKCLFKEKLLNVITEFYETTPSVEIPPYPNVDPFNYDTMKNSLLERLDSFSSAPFTVQRICELLTYPRKQYNRVDKFMRAVEKNILVVSTREPGPQRHAEPENGEPAEPIVNGSDSNSEYNVDVEMEDMSWKENAEQQQPAEPQPSSSETHISVDDIEARLNAKQDAPMQAQEKVTTEYESVTPPELNVATEEQEMKATEEDKPSNEESKPAETPAPTAPAVEHVEVSEKMEDTTNDKMESTTEQTAPDEPKIDIEMKPVEQEIESAKDPLIIPVIKVDDADMTEQRLAEESKTSVDEEVKETPVAQEPVQKDEPAPVEEKSLVVEKEEDKQLPAEEVQEKPSPVEETAAPAAAIDENTSDPAKEEPETKPQPEVFSEESQSSSSDNTDGNSNSPKTEPQSDSQESSSDANADTESAVEKPEAETPHIETDNYSISDVKSELPQPQAEPAPETEEVGKGEPAPEGPQREIKEDAEKEKKEEAKEKTETQVTSEVCSEN